VVLLGKTEEVIEGAGVVEGVKFGTKSIV